MPKSSGIKIESVVEIQADTVRLLQDAEEDAQDKADSKDNFVSFSRTLNMQNSRSLNFTRKSANRYQMPDNPEKGDEKNTIDNRPVINVSEFDRQNSRVFSQKQVDQRKNDKDGILN